MPTLTIIGGPDGSGKTTLTSYLLQNGRIKTDIVIPTKLHKTKSVDMIFIYRQRNWHCNEEMMQSTKILTLPSKLHFPAILKLTIF